MSVPPDPPDLAGLRLGYVPYSSGLDMPGDRRRFVHYARRRGLRFELADPSRPYDVVVLSERADISLWSRYRGGRIVYDLIDSYLAIPRTSLKGRLRGLAKFAAGQSRHLQLDHWKAVEAMCRRADAVVCTTAEQRRDILPSCSNVHVILDAHSGVAREVKTDWQAGPILRIAWEGLGANVRSLRLLRDVLRTFDCERPTCLTLVTDPEHARFLGRIGRVRTADVARSIFHRVEIHPWSEETCARVATSCDLAVIPLDLSNPFEAGKPENKLLLFWRMGVPVLASATPAYRAAMSAAGLDMACTTEDDWLRALRRLSGDAGLRRESAMLGRRYVEAHHDEEALLARWDTVFRTIL